MVKGILMDYGGTIDTNGKHWGEVLWEMYQRHQVPVSKLASSFSKHISHLLLLLLLQLFTQCLQS